MSRTAAAAATMTLALWGLSGAVQAQTAAPAASAAPARQPADAATRASYDRADALSRSVFWSNEQQINPMDPVAGATNFVCDFTDDDAPDRLKALLGGPVDVVLSDMAPNLSGVATVDQARSMHLCELALDFATQHLKPGGQFLVKVFQGEGFMEYRKQMDAAFASVQVRKPKASRDRSAEVYLLGKGPRQV